MTDALFLGLPIILDGTQTLVRRVTTRRARNFRVHRSVYSSQVWEWGFRTWTNDRAEAVDFYDSFMDIWGGSTGEFRLPIGQHVDDPGITIDMPTTELTAGTNLITHKQPAIVVPNGRFVKFADHSRVYLVRQSQPGQFSIKPNLTVDVMEDTEISTANADVIYTGIDIRDNPMSLALPKNGIMYFDIELVEKV